MAPSQPHFLLVPYTEQGHINPMLCFASLLASLGCTITFVKADHKTTLPVNGDDALQTHHLQPPAFAHCLRFVSLSPAPVSDHPSMTRHEVLKKTPARMGERQVLLEKLMAKSKATSDPISCVVCDIMVWKWVKDVTKKEAIIGTVLVTNCATTMYMLHLMNKGKGKPHYHRTRSSNFPHGFPCTRLHQEPNNRKFYPNSHYNSVANYDNIMSRAAHVMWAGECRTPVHGGGHWH